MKEPKWVNGGDRLEEIIEERDTDSETMRARIYDTVSRDALIHDNARLRLVIHQFLEAPYKGGTAIRLSISIACVEVGHPVVESIGMCVCEFGKRAKGGMSKQT